ncbi:MAG: hypothetical protein O3A51_00280 [Verrucomicrobia bacterium]|nr:hypothetical protein [Verrucomicrobiota bacterium]
MSKRKPYTMYVISHTHWDREWYQTFQGYRRRLVYQIDAMVDLLEQRADFACFHLDGQTSVLDDYLAIRPEQKKRLARHIRSGRVLIGPWFTMPDEAHVSGESLIRNLQLGHRHCREWQTDSMPIGWVSDVFSHVSQLPQILADFNIDCAYMHHGTPCEAGEQTEMVWVGADGTQTLLIKSYPWYGYQDILQMRYRTREEIRAFECKKLALASTKVLLGLDGNDHEAAKWDTPEFIDYLNDHLEKTHAVHASLPEYVRAIRKALGPDWTKGRRHFSGELRVPTRIGNWNGLTDGTGSSRLPIKQANDEVSWLLERQAEPLHAWARLLGGQSQRAYLDEAWRYLLLNHPHDSICGCSIDQVHRDMMYRFDQARMLANDALDNAVQVIADRIDLSSLRAADYAVTIFNPASSPTGPTTRLTLEIPSGRREDGQPCLFDETGAAVQADIVSIAQSVRARPFTFEARGVTPAIWARRGYPVDRYTVDVLAAIPACGYQTWGITLKNRPPSRTITPPAVTVKATPGLLENEHVKLRVRADGRVDVHDKATDTWFRGLNEMEDTGDAGDGWVHVYPHRNRTIRSRQATARGAVKVSVAHRGKLSATLTVSYRLRVPAALERTDRDSHPAATGTARTKRLATLSIRTVYTLSATSRRIDCRTTIDNTAECHRVRALFPTRRKARTWYGDSAFDLVERPIELRKTPGWKEVDREECPILNVAAVCDQTAGLAILSKGLYEAAVQDNPTRTLALTLLRGFIERLNDVETTDSLLLGTQTMEYAIRPFTPAGGRPPHADLYGEMEHYKLALLSYTRPPSGAPMDNMTLPPCNELDPPQPVPSVGAEVLTASKTLTELRKKRPDPKQNQPMAHALLALPAPLVLSTVTAAKTATTLNVRLWNPTARTVTRSLQVLAPLRRATLVNLLDQERKKLPMENDSIALTVQPKQILTVQLGLRRR